MMAAVLFLALTATVVLKVGAVGNYQERTDIFCAPLPLPYKHWFTEPYRPYSDTFSDICVTIGFPRQTDKHWVDYLEKGINNYGASRLCDDSSDYPAYGALVEKQDAIWLLQNTHIGGRRSNVSYWVDDPDAKSYLECTFLHVDASGNIIENKTSCVTELDLYLCYTMAINAPCFSPYWSLILPNNCTYTGKNPHNPDLIYKCNTCTDGKVRGSWYVSPTTTTSTSSTLVHAIAKLAGQLLLLVYFMH